MRKGVSSLSLVSVNTSFLAVSPLESVRSAGQLQQVVSKYHYCMLLFLRLSNLNPLQAIALDYLLY